ncbi:Ig-like domain repeat protein [Curtobacterium sp. MCSS17_015]|uniref:Ig-like domain repeat protein n=1 Tax=Curtobacterium sp. MCSS17_015 TaxID=2175666 RepID=UPI000DAA1F3D|nr:Ig-like domain repeat protein [Curtobacterium sp. MCSS17_015]WIB25769.1 Ig-like domain repeat protein [Curtobacterium sp. MCSS17_015]
MKANTFCKIGVTFGATALIVGALAVPAAQADPVGNSFGTLVGLGSDTTQDVMNGVATAVGGGQLASYDAANAGPSVVTRPGGKAIPRVSGSGAGRDALLVAIGAIASKSGVALADGTSTTVDSSVVGQLDFARSSSGPSSTASDGVVAYVPFARDAVDVAYAPGSQLAKVPFFVGDGTQAKTAPTLWNVYRGDVTHAYFNADGSYNSVGSAATGPDGTTAAKIKPLLPKFGSGTRSYFLGKLGLTDASGFTSTSPFVSDTVDGQPIEEHNGQAILDSTSGSTLAVAPFSVSQWVAQANGVGTVKDRRHGVVLAPLSVVDGKQAPATTGSGTSYATNPAYAGFVRDVYNIVPSRLADDPTSAIAKTFVGKDSLVCKQTATIAAYGFLPEPATTPATTCGYDQLRSITASPSTTKLSVPATATAGKAVTASVSVDSFGAGGGTVKVFKGNAVVGTGTIARGATSGTAPVTLPVGSASLTAQFVPSLAGVASSTSAPATVAVAPATAVSLSVPKLTVGKTAKVTVKVTGAGPSGGTVTLKNGKETLGTAKVPAAGTATISFVPKAVSYKFTTTYTASGSGAVATNTTGTVKAAKGAPTVTVSAIKSVKASAKAKVAVRVTGTGSVPTGTVTVKEGSKKLASGTVSSKDGRVTVTLPKLKAGTHKLTVSYSGSTTWNGADKAATLKVTK